MEEDLAKPPPICYKCDKSRHLARNCRSNIDEPLYANSAEYFDAALAIECIDYYYYNHWYMDSGATDYIVSKPSKFKQNSYLGILISEVRIGGGESHKI